MSANSPPSAGHYQTTMSGEQYQYAQLLQALNVKFEELKKKVEEGRKEQEEQVALTNMSGEQYAQFRQAQKATDVEMKKLEEAMKKVVQAEKELKEEFEEKRKEEQKIKEKYRRIFYAIRKYGETFERMSAQVEAIKNELELLD